LAREGVSGWKILSLKGMLFDVIETIELVWSRDSQYLLISRRGVSVLKAWENNALKEVVHCPYENQGGRYNAFWRTHLADYPGDKAVPEEGKQFFDMC
jgi:hypothetical protein